MNSISLNNQGNPKIIAMVHVHSNNVLRSTAYNKLFGVPTISHKEFVVLESARKHLIDVHEQLMNETKQDLLRQSRSSVFLLRQKETAGLLNEVSLLPSVASIVDRALREVEIYQRNGISIVEVENIGAPYFLKHEVRWEDLLIMYLVCQAIRKQFPKMMMGVHVLSSDDADALPLGLAVNALFVRSESTLFSGFRPEGYTGNNGDLAKYYYLRNWLRLSMDNDDPNARHFPYIWSDLQKKHTVFQSELMNLDVWLRNLLFMKLEGVILSGSETGKDIFEHDLELARLRVDEHKRYTSEQFGAEVVIPVITGSGLNVPMYKRYADFVITGTQLKKNKYWENEVEEDNVKQLVEKFN